MPSALSRKIAEALSAVFFTEEMTAHQWDELADLIERAGVGELEMRLDAARDGIQAITNMCHEKAAERDALARWKEADWCDLCDAPQMVLANGEHRCWSLRRMHVEYQLLSQRIEAAVAWLERHPLSPGRAVRILRGEELE